MHDVVPMAVRKAVSAATMTFTRMSFAPEDFGKITKEEGLTGSTPRVYLNRMLSRELIMQTADGYTKLLVT